MEIKCLNAYQSTLEINKMLWKVSSRKVTLILCLLLVFSLSLYVYGSMHSTEFTKSSSYLSESSVQISTFNNYSNRHILESIGMVMTLFLLLIFYYQKTRKRFFFERVEENAKRFLETGNEYSIKIDENLVEYKSHDLYMKMNWVLFSKYKIYKDYVFLYFRDEHQIIGIDKRLLSAEDLDVFFKLLKEKDVQKIK